jgi:hypothetical protein
MDWGIFPNQPDGESGRDSPSIVHIRGQTVKGKDFQRPPQRFPWTHEARGIGHGQGKQNVTHEPVTPHGLRSGHRR